MKGHTPFTCEPLFAEILELRDGTPVLRMYEWERIRQVVFQIDAYLPDNSPLLFVKVKIENTTGSVVPMYWWSNIAVPESPSVSVLSPSNTAFKCLYENGSYSLDRINMPYCLDTDMSYPTNSKRVQDFFYIIPESRRKWETAVEKWRENDGDMLIEYYNQQYKQ